MKSQKLDKYNPNYTYKKHGVTIDRPSANSSPILEKTDNALLYPEAIRNDIDTEQLEPLE